MSKHLKYLSYVVRHKWFVLLECLKYGLVWQGLVHDFSKFRPSEWKPYVDYFHMTDEEKNEETMEAFRLYKIVEAAPFGHFARERFHVAWLHHQKRNPHHWQYWVITMDTGKTFALEMPDKYAKEMLCDWRGAGRALHGKDETKSWYLKNRDNMNLRMSTRQWVEKELGIQRNEGPVISGCAVCGGIASVNGVCVKCGNAIHETTS